MGWETEGIVFQGKLNFIFLFHLSAVNGFKNNELESND